MSWSSRQMTMAATSVLRRLDGRNQGGLTRNECMLRCVLWWSRRNAFVDQRADVIVSPAWQPVIRRRPGVGRSGGVPMRRRWQHRQRWQLQWLLLCPLSIGRRHRQCRARRQNRLLISPRGSDKSLYASVICTLNNNKNKILQNELWFSLLNILGR